jgi:transcription elongation factor Elf1
MQREELYWKNCSEWLTKSFTCGYCGNLIASEKGYYAYVEEHIEEYLFICPYCLRPTYFDSSDNQTPGPICGNNVDNVPDNVGTLYDEARKCISCNAYTGSILCSRKLLMNIAVSKGAKEGQSFVNYINFLSEKNYIPPDGKDWVNHIRKKGNDATHEISIMNREDAIELISFIEMLLKIIFEFPTIIKKKSSNSTFNNQS